MEGYPFVVFLAKRTVRCQAAQGRYVLVDKLPDKLPLRFLLPVLEFELRPYYALVPGKLANGGVLKVPIALRVNPAHHKIGLHDSGIWPSEVHEQQGVLLGAGHGSRPVSIDDGDVPLKDNIQSSIEVVALPT